MTIVIDPFGTDVTNKYRDTSILHPRKMECLRGHDTRDPDSRENGSCKKCKNERNKERNSKNKLKRRTARQNARVRQELPSWMNIPGASPCNLYPVWAVQTMMYQRGITLADVARQMDRSRERVRQSMIAAVKGVPGHIERLEEAISKITETRGGVYATLSPDDDKIAQIKRIRTERFVNG